MFVNSSLCVTSHGCTEGRLRTSSWIRGAQDRIAWWGIYIKVLWVQSGGSSFRDNDLILYIWCRLLCLFVCWSFQLAHRGVFVCPLVCSIALCLQDVTVCEAELWMCESLEVGGSAEADVVAEARKSSFSKVMLFFLFISFHPNVHLFSCLWWFKVFSVKVVNFPALPSCAVFCCNLLSSVSLALDSLLAPLQWLSAPSWLVSPGVC